MPRFSRRQPEEGPLTFAFDAPALALAGHLFTRLAANPEDGRPFYARRSFRAGLVFALGFYGVSLTLYAVAPEWMTGYHGAPPALTIWTALFFGAFLYAMPFAGFYALGIELRRENGRAWALALVALVLAFGGVLVATWGTLTHVGLPDEAKAGTAPPPWSHPEVGPRLTIGGAILSVYLAAFLVSTHRRRHAARPPAFDREEVRVLEAVALRFFEPDAAGLGGQFARYMEDMATANLVALRRAVDLVQYSPLWFLGRPRRFTSLGPADQDRYLERFSHSRLLPFRMAFTVLKTGLFLLYYERAEVLERIGAGAMCLGKNRPLPAIARPGTRA